MKFRGGRSKRAAKKKMLELDFAVEIMVRVVDEALLRGPIVHVFMVKEPTE